MKQWVASAIGATCEGLLMMRSDVCGKALDWREGCRLKGRVGNLLETAVPGGGWEEC